MITQSFHYPAYGDEQQIPIPCLQLDEDQYYDAELGDLDFHRTEVLSPTNSLWSDYRVFNPDRKVYVFVRDYADALELLRLHGTHMYWTRAHLNGCALSAVTLTFLLAKDLSDG